MEALFSLVKRNYKVFSRDKALVFFTFLSVIIVIVLYALFLQKMQVDSIKQVTNDSDQVITMVNEWVVAGLLSMMAVTSTLSVFGIAVKDLETKSTSDFLTAPVSRVTIQLSYVFTAFVIGILFSIIGLIACEIFLVVTGGQLLSLSAFFEILGIMILSVLLASAFNIVLTLFTSTQSSFSTLGSIVGTLIGFLCGLYVPMGALPSFAQHVIMYFPISHTTLLMRNAFVENSMKEVFAAAPAEAIEQYKLMYGFTYELHGQELSILTSYIVVIVSTLVFSALSVYTFKRKYR